VWNGGGVTGGGHHVAVTNKRHSLRSLDTQIYILDKYNRHNFVGGQSCVIKRTAKRNSTPNLSHTLLTKRPIDASYSVYRLTKSVALVMKGT